ncbi:hypothetical protein CL634_10235 [bacterium]|nr:hypothetical protein [bacterium]
MEVAVLGRGHSLKAFDLLPKVERYVITNDFCGELKQKNIKAALSEAKGISHVCMHYRNIMRYMIRGGYYNEFPITERIIPHGTSSVVIQRKGAFCRVRMLNSRFRKIPHHETPLKALSTKIESLVSQIEPEDHHLGSTGIPSTII